MVLPSSCASLGREIEMKEAERIAKLAVESMLPSAKMLFCKDQSGGRHDFDLRLPSGQMAALEVTTSTNEQLMSAIAAIGAPAREGPSSARRGAKRIGLFTLGQELRSRRYVPALTNTWPQSRRRASSASSVRRTAPATRRWIGSIETSQSKLVRSWRGRSLVKSAFRHRTEASLRASTFRALFERKPVKRIAERSSARPAAVNAIFSCTLILETTQHGNLS